MLTENHKEHDEFSVRCDRCASLVVVVTLHF